MIVVTVMVMVMVTIMVLVMIIRLDTRIVRSVAEIGRMRRAHAHDPVGRERHRSNWSVVAPPVQ